MTSARSIWSQAAAKFSPIGPSSVPRLLAYFQQSGGVRLVGGVAGAGVFAQLVFEMGVDGAGFDEADQAVGEVLLLGAGGQPDGDPAGGDVIDDGAAVVGFGDAAVDELLVQGQVGERAGLGQPVAGSGRRSYAVISLMHRSRSCFRVIEELGICAWVMR
jgi:hypothetical protein